jgi:hypothetical protein
MLGRELLIFPDTGDEFTRTLRTSALSADRVHSLTIVGVPDRNARLGPLMKKIRTKSKNLTVGQDYMLKRLEEYGAFTKEAGSELITAKQAGILSPIKHVDEFFGAGLVGVRRFRDLSITEKKWSPLAQKLARASELCPPSFFDMEFIALARDAGVDFDLARQGFFLKYLLALMEISETRGLTLTSWSPIFRNLMWEIQKAFGTSGPAARASTAARLSQIVFERRLPRADDLPVEELLKIREQRQDELEAFRTAIAELAVKIDGTQAHDRVERQISDLVSTRIDPAVRKLRSAVTVSRLDALKRVFRRSWTSVAAKATLPAVLAYFGTGRVEMSAVAAAAALGAVLLPFAQAELDRRKLLTNSPWSLLLKLK